MNIATLFIMISATKTPMALAQQATNEQIMNYFSFGGSLGTWIMIIMASLLAMALCPILSAPKYDQVYPDGVTRWKCLGLLFLMIGSILGNQGSGMLLEGGFIILLFLLYLVMIIIGKQTMAVKGKRWLTVWMFFFIGCVIVNTWRFLAGPIDKEDEDPSLDSIPYVAAIISCAFLYGQKMEVKIYKPGALVMNIVVIMYNTIIILRGYSIENQLIETLLPILLFSIVILLNYQEFSESSVNTRFVYGIGLIITMFLLYIIKNTKDIKIKSLITVFLVILYNILAILYGNKDCNEVGGVKLVGRVLKWSTIVTIVVLILWKDFFQTYIGDNAKSIADSVGYSSAEDRIKQLKRDRQEKLHEKGADTIAVSVER